MDSSPESRAPAAALYRLTNAIQPALRAWRQAANLVLESSGISFSLASALVLIARHPAGMSQSALAEQTGVNAGATVRTVDQGEAAGLMERRAVASDRRANAVHVLPLGSALAQSMEHDLSELRAKLFNDLSDEEIATTTRVLSIIERRAISFVQERAAS